MGYHRLPGGINPEIHISTSGSLHRFATICFHEHRGNHPMADPIPGLDRRQFLRAATVSSALVGAAVPETATEVFVVGGET